MNLDTFTSWLAINGNAQGSIKSYCSLVTIFFSHNQELTQETLDAFIAEKLKTCNGNSINSYLASLKKYATFSKLNLKFPKSHKTESRIKKPISEDELIDIMGKLGILFNNPRKIKLLLLLMFQVGLRPKELLQLTRNDFNLEKKTVIISKTKTFKSREVSLSNELCDDLVSYFQQESEKDNAFNISYQSLRGIFRKIKKYFGIKKEFNPYIMRHSNAHDLLKKGVKLTSLQKHMGHDNIETTTQYLRVEEEEAREEIRKVLNKKKRKRKSC